MNQRIPFSDPIVDFAEKSIADYRHQILKNWDNLATPRAFDETVAERLIDQMTDDRDWLTEQAAHARSEAAFYFEFGGDEDHWSRKQGEKEEVVAEAIAFYRNDLTAAIRELRKALKAAERCPTCGK